MNNFMNMLGTSSGNRRGTGSSGRRGFTGDIIPKGYEVGQLQQFTPQAMELYDQLFPHLGPESQTARLARGDEGMFAEMEAPELRQFGGVMGNLASRFSGMGMGARRSSGFQNAAYEKGSDFAQRLAAKRQELSRQALLDLFGMSEKLMNQKPYQRDLFEKPQREPALGGWGPVLGTLGGGAAGFFAGGPMGAFTGASIGSKAFSGL